LSTVTRASGPIVLVPGLNCSARIFAAQIQPLWGFGPVTVANHLYGDSIAAMARAILEDAPPRFLLVGFSLGGYLAFEMIRRAPQRIEGLALLNTSARPDMPAQTAFRQQLMAAARDDRFHEITEEQFPRLVHASRRDDERLRRIYLTMTREMGAEAFLRHQQAIIERADSRPDLARIRCPALVLGADSDQIMPAEAAAEMAAGIAGARLVMLAECGHLAPIEKPSEVTAALVEWAAGIPRA
jgi:pimeloyl-ACP methyl ester carboxylesterase